MRGWRSSCRRSRPGRWTPRTRSCAGAATGAGAGGAGAGAKAVWLEPGELRDLLTAYGLRMPEADVAASAEAAAQLARRVGFPVAIKLASRTITHKSDVGGVVLDVR